jgi:hypothetical protein
MTAAAQSQLRSFGGRRTHDAFYRDSHQLALDPVGHAMRKPSCSVHASIREMRRVVPEPADGAGGGID